MKNQQKKAFVGVFIKEQFIAQQQLKKLENTIMQAEGENRTIDNVQLFTQKDQGTNSSTENYKLQLSLREAAFIQKFLPPGYSLQIQSKIQKRASTITSTKASRPALTKKKSVDTKLLNQNELIESEINRLPSMRTKKSVNIKYNDEASEMGYAKYVPTYPSAEMTRRNTYEGLDESLKPCVKILNLLKNSKTSWPFRQPVDPVALGIPQYIEIVKEPMDLSKIQKNLKTGQYATPTQFHADINKIIRNSYTFNQGNADFTRVTQQFQQYYFKVIAEPNLDQKGVGTYNEATSISKPASQVVVASKIVKKKPQKPYSYDNPISLAEKKELSINIRRLPRQYMKGIVDIVRQQGDSKIKDEFDLEDLRPETIRELQNYVRSKLMEPPQRLAENKNQMNKDANEESQFSIESQQDS